MNEAAILALIEQSCWARIGVWGDGSCAELPSVSHCRNCEVYAAAGRRLLDRPVPGGYLESWANVLADEEQAAASATASHVVFRIGQVWLSITSASLREITDPRVIRRVPHRAPEALLGLANVRGELHPCVSLHLLFGEEAPAPAPRTTRFLVARWGVGDWVFPVDHVEGIHDVRDDQIEPLPATLLTVGSAYARGLFHLADKTVAIVDSGVLFPALERRLT